MPEFLVTAKADHADDALTAIKQVLEDISAAAYMPGFPDSARWATTASNGVHVRVTLMTDGVLL